MRRRWALFFAGLDSPPGVALNIELGGTGGAACERIKKRGSSTLHRRRRGQGWKRKEDKGKGKGGRGKGKRGGEEGLWEGQGEGWGGGRKGGGVGGDWKLQGKQFRKATRKWEGASPPY